MVPWVRWPRDSDHFSTANKQILLQEPVELMMKDNAAQVMPLKEIMNRIVVDRKLHTGEVSDTQLAMADMKANKMGGRVVNGKSSLDCSPFC
ncbi:hypothetical protein GUITHDRAFT_151190 [Guillardia theta CCMP2712]|uniref:Uncharacterized protein n=2 Tax=Guillardia theta TaxID=55529 RepID=L1JR50_GUITC|nr:hypothetical protein GUITHDRAFT_151190 [Guillardia theta CCMP2712]EKX50568.1 hypothetical protein GUITHDRAFT_151190 [Guillardia theta CCMP2712]|eukprot:XP_005837548.1 hypothetical protein GUITHDRAFT_151190 [Guillardia theta CCMP2712]